MWTRVGQHVELLIAVIGTIGLQFGIYYQPGLSSSLIIAAM